MNDVQELLKKQAEWQRKLRSLTWAEKIRMAEEIRESVLRLGPSANGPTAVSLLSAASTKDSTKRRRKAGPL